MGLPARASAPRALDEIKELREEEKFAAWWNAREDAAALREATQCTS